MLSYVIIFFILAAVSAFLGFGNLAGTFSQIAKVLAVVFAALVILGLIKHLL